MKTLDSLFVSVGLLFLRVSFGLMMLIAHGWPKLSGYSGLVEGFSDPLGIGSQMSLIGAISAEVFCSMLLILGLFTRFAAIPLAFTMVVAFFIVHTDDPWKVKELAMAYLLVYVTLIFTGGGAFSIDRMITGAKAGKASPK